MSTCPSIAENEALMVDPLDVSQRDLDEWLALDSTRHGFGAILSPRSDVTEECIEDDPPARPGRQPVVASSDSMMSIDTSPNDTSGHYFGPARRELMSRFIVTFFPPDADESWLKPETYFQNPVSTFQIWAGQFETCPNTGKLHAHIYCESKRNRRPRFQGVNDAFRKYHQCVNIKKARHSSKKQRQAAINYVLDEEKRAKDTACFNWHWNNPAVKYDPTCVNSREEDRRSKAEDLVEKQRAYIETKPRIWTWDKIVHEHEESKKLLCTCSWGAKYHAGRMASDPRRTIRNVIILYGAGGTGKTTAAQDWDTRPEEDPRERIYRRNPDDGAFWGGGRSAYNSQRIVHYEEFTGQEAFSRLKEVCDIGKAGPPINLKNSGGELNHETVIFTSNVHPAGWFRKLWAEDPKQFHPFWRRVTQVYFYPSHRSDGSLNIPDENNPPHFIDQTVQWKQLGGDYDQAKSHAETYWPLRVESSEAMLFNPGGDKATPENPFYSYCKSGVDPTNIWGRPN